MTDAERDHASNVARAGMMCHQQLLVLLVARLPQGAELLCAEFEGVSHDGIAQLEAQAPAEFVEAYKLARQSLLFNLEEVLSQVDKPQSNPH